MRNFDHNSGEHLQIDDAKIYYEVTGSQNSPALLVLHGGFGTLEDFNTILPELESEFKVIGIDSRSQGKSTRGKQALTYEQIQKDVEQVLAHLDIDTLSIIGFSDGGIAAYRLASLTSLNIEKLVTIGAYWHIKNAEPSRELYSRITGASWKKRFPDSYDAYQKLNSELNSESDFDFLAKSLIEMWLDSSSSGLPNEAVEDINCPLLIVRGDDDQFLSREAAVELSRLVKNSKFLNIPFAGHVAFEEQKEIFMISLNEFLKQ